MCSLIVNNHELLVQPGVDTSPMGWGLGFVRVTNEAIDQNRANRCLESMVGSIGRHAARTESPVNRTAGFKGLSQHIGCIPSSGEGSGHALVYG